MSSSHIYLQFQLKINKWFLINLISTLKISLRLKIQIKLKLNKINRMAMRMINHMHSNKHQISKIQSQKVIKNKFNQGSSLPIKEMSTILYKKKSLLKFRIKWLSKEQRMIQIQTENNKTMILNKEQISTIRCKIYLED